MVISHDSSQDDIPTGSLKFHYGAMDPLHDHGGYTTVSVSDNTMTTSFYDYTGIYYTLHIFTPKCHCML